MHDYQGLFLRGRACFSEDICETHRELLLALGPRPSYSTDFGRSCTRPVSHVHSSPFALPRPLLSVILCIVRKHTRTEETFRLRPFVRTCTAQQQRPWTLTNMFEPTKMFRQNKSWSRSTSDRSRSPRPFVTTVPRPYPGPGCGLSASRIVEAATESSMHVAAGHAASRLPRST